MEQLEILISNLKNYFFAIRHHPHHYQGYYEDIIREYQIIVTAQVNSDPEIKILLRRFLNHWTCEFVKPIFSVRTKPELEGCYLNYCSAYRALSLIYL